MTVSPSGFQLYDVSDFPIVRIEGRNLPDGYGQRWVEEMDALLARDEPLCFIFLSSVANPLHEDQRRQTHWLKQNKKALAKICHGAVAIEPDRALRLLKRAQGVVMAAAFGLKYVVVADHAAAERRARELLSGIGHDLDDE